MLLFVIPNFLLLADMANTYRKHVAVKDADPCLSIGGFCQCGYLCCLPGNIFFFSFCPGFVLPDWVTLKKWLLSLLSAQFVSAALNCSESLCCYRSNLIHRGVYNIWINIIKYMGRY